MIDDGSHKQAFSGCKASQPGCGVRTEVCPGRGTYLTELAD